MKFEIDPNELTTDQRAHVAAFITNWPVYSEVSNLLKEILAAPETEEFKMAKRAGGIAGARNLSEEQRLDAEQKSDLGPIGDADLKNLVDIPEVDLNAIFGAPDISKQMQENIVAHAETVANLNSLVPLDSQGLPWDSRIHASTKTFIADGSWKLRRGVDPAEVEKVKAQLKELMAVPVTTKPAFTLEIPHVPVDLNVPKPPTSTIVGVDFGAGPDITVVTPIPPAPRSHYLIDQDPTVAANQQPPTTVTLTDLIGRMSKAIAENRLTQAAVKEMCVKHGVSEFHLLGNRPDLLPLIDADMKATGV